MTTVLKLYELANARDILDEFLMETEGEVTPELAALLDEIEGDIKEKIERVGLYAQEQAATAKAVKAEAERLTARARAMEKAADGLKNYLKYQMVRLGQTKVVGLLCTVSRQKNSVAGIQCAITPEALALTEPALVTRQEIVTYSLDRDAILARWKAGQALPETVVVEQGEHVRVR